MQEALALYATASTLQLSSDESKAMMATFDDEIVNIRPDGHLYIPQTYYRERLNSTIGVGQWGLVPKATTQEVNGAKVKLLLNGIMVIRKCFVAEAVGEAEIHATNENQSLASVWESAKSDCITRCCKDLSIGNQIYQPNYINAWKKQFAIQVWVKDKNAPLWRKKDGEPLPKETGIVGEQQPPAGDGQKKTYGNPNDQLPWLNKTTRAGGETKEWIDTVNGLLDGSLTMEALEEKFKLSKGTKFELAEIMKNKPSAGSSTPKPVTGAAYAQLEKCKYQQDVDELAARYKEEITSNPEWRTAFMAAKQKLPKRNPQTV